MKDCEGVELVAPLRKAKFVKEDHYCQDGDQFRYPYPLTSTKFLVSYTPCSNPKNQFPEPYGLYWMDVQGQHELLASDPKLGCYHAVPLTARHLPLQKPATVDYGEKEGVYFVQDVYTGMGLHGVPRARSHGCTLSRWITGAWWLEGPCSMAPVVLVFPTVRLQLAPAVMT